MIGEINYKIVVGVIHNFSAMFFFIAVFICGLSSSMFTKGAYGPSFMNMLYMMGNFDWSPTSRLQMVSRVTLDTGCGGGSGLVGGDGLGGWVWAMWPGPKTLVLLFRLVGFGSFGGWLGEGCGGWCDGWCRWWLNG